MVKLPNLTRRRATIDVTDNVETVCGEVAKKAVSDGKKFRPKIKLPFRGRRGTGAAGCAVDAVPETVPEVVLSFEENLHQNRLAEASLQLIARENAIFGPGTDEDSVDADGRAKETDQLQMDYEILQVRLWMVVHETFQDKPGEDNLAALRSTVNAIQQEEEQDKRWLEPEGQQAPEWRPRQLLLNHNNLVQKIVDSRVDKAEDEEKGADKLSTALKKQVCKIGKRVQADLLKIVKDVKQCYPMKLDVCQMYARLYHQAFSRRLREFTQTNLDVEDCAYLLLWVNSYFPTDVLKHKELKEHLDSESLGPLLSEDDIKPLEEQYLSYKQTTVRDWLTNALRTEEERWIRGDWPELIDEYYVSHLAVDVIGLVTPLAQEAQTILGDEGKVKRLQCPLEDFLVRYKKALEDFSKGRRETSRAVMKANLVSIEQFREFVDKKEKLFKEQTRTPCLSILAKLRDYCHSYFLCPILKELKVHCRCLWTPAWFAGKQGVPNELVGILEGQSYEFRDLKPICREELLGQIHFEVITLYVKKLLKRKIKLRDREQQEAGATLLCEDSKKLNTLFTDMGSKNGWLDKVMCDLAEVIRLQDPGAIQLEVVTLAREHPDFGDKHVSALLHLKTHLTSMEIRRIRESLAENRGTSSERPAPVFFTKVPVK
ncbi:tumor necrosis factor alpha-induced protein 2a isoform X2 [Sardina pilchardus]|uniref:tumor necrosis factor alpha-induced protein 2a isoform X2 n=1 Tax=Sardina pilchardus TaxID=27697 RepID=UPI002E1348A9